VIVPESDDETVQGDCVESVSDVKVRVEAFQTSDASVPNDVSVLPLYAQMLAGNDVTALANCDAKEVEAARNRRVHGIRAGDDRRSQRGVAVETVEIGIRVDGRGDARRLAVGIGVD